MPSLDPVWQIIKPDYKLLSILGQGTFGQVIHAMHRESRTNVAIKFIKTKFDNQVECKNIFRELSLLRQFSEMKGNIFVTKLLDVKLASDGKDGIENAKGMFFIMEHVPNDLKQMMKMVDNNCFEEEHVKIIFYNLLCALNFVHTANVMHRDIKPANLLIDSSC